MNKSVCTSKILIPLIVAILSLAGIFSSCSDEKYGIHAYSFGFSESDANATEAEMQTILDAYRTAIGFTGYEAAIAGTEDECNDKVLAGCAKAEAQVAELQLKGGYMFRVVNQATYKVIYTKGFGSFADKDTPTDE